MELKNYLTSIVDYIKKYYRCSSWVVRQRLQPCHYVDQGYFVDIKNGEIGDEITLLKAIFKDHDYKIFSKDIPHFSLLSNLYFIMNSFWGGFAYIENQDSTFFKNIILGDYQYYCCSTTLKMINHFYIVNLFTFY